MPRYKLPTRGIMSIIDHREGGLCLLITNHKYYWYHMGKDYAIKAERHGLEDASEVRDCAVTQWNKYRKGELQ